MSLEDPKFAAKIAALSFMQTRTMADLLRKSGEPIHAENVYKAIEVAVVVIGISLGHENIKEAMDAVEEKFRKNKIPKRKLH